MRDQIVQRGGVQSNPNPIMRPTVSPNGSARVAAEAAEGVVSWLGGLGGPMMVGGGVTARKTSGGRAMKRAMMWERQASGCLRC